MAIVANPNNSWSVNSKVGPIPNSAGGTRYFYTRIASKSARKDTNYINRRLAMLPLAIIPYDRQSRLEINYPQPTTYPPYQQYIPEILSTYLERFSGASKDAATVALLKKISNADVSLGTALAEMPSTVKHLTGTAKRITGGFRSLRKGDVRGAFRALGIRDNYRISGSKLKYKSAKAHKQALIRRSNKTHKTDLAKFASQSWLELQYGWKPLLMDAYGVCAATAKHLHGLHIDCVFAASSRGTYTLYEQNAANVVLTMEPDSKYFIRREARYEVVNPDLRRAVNFGLTDPALIAWEVVPFSFVVDWFLPVSDYLQSAFGNVGLKYIDGGFTTFYSGAASRRIKLNGYNNASSRVERFLIKRETASQPIATFPKFSLFDKMNGTKFTSALALLKVVFGGGK